MRADAVRNVVTRVAIVLRPQCEEREKMESKRTRWIQSTEQVVDVIEQVIEKPVPEIYTNPTSANLVQRYYQDIPTFDDEMSARTRG